MTKIILVVSMLCFAVGCESEKIANTETDITAIETAPFLSEKEAILQLESIRKKINDGEDFATLAQKYSQDPGSGTQGGDLGWAEKGMMVPAFEKAALALQPQEISAPVKTEFGYHLVMLHEINGDRYHTSHILVRLGE